MHALVEWIQKRIGIKSFYIGVALGTLLFVILLVLSPSAIVRGLQFMIVIAPLWLPFFLARISWHLWITYKRSAFIVSQEEQLLEIRLPREVTKSPLAMEAVFAGLHLGPGETT